MIEHFVPSVESKAAGPSLHQADPFSRRRLDVDSDCRPVGGWLAKLATSDDRRRKLPALDGGRRKFKSTFDGPPSCVTRRRATGIAQTVVRDRDSEPDSKSSRLALLQSRSSWVRAAPSVLRAVDAAQTLGTILTRPRVPPRAVQPLAEDLGMGWRG